MEIKRKPNKTRQNNGLCKLNRLIIRSDIKLFNYNLIKSILESFSLVKSIK